jgi:hypothetical protein
MFQLIKKTPEAKPTMAVLSAEISPKYSGAKNRESAPKVFKKPPPTVANNIYQMNRKS